MLVAYLPLQLAKHHHNILEMLLVQDLSVGHIFNFPATIRSLTTACKEVFTISLVFYYFSGESWP
jgi:hypothetical protein